GLPVRYSWAQDYRGSTTVVYGHTPVPAAEWLNNTLNIDTGCVFGGRLTALRWTEREIVQVSAHRVYADPVRPLHPSGQRETVFIPDALPSAEEIAARNAMAELVHKTVATHVENRKQVARALAHRNNLQAEVDKEERLLQELGRKGEIAAQSGNS